MAILLNDNLNVAAPKPTDARYGPHADIATALAAINTAKRYQGLTVGILDAGVAKDYWFASGIADGDLVLKTTGGGAVGATGPQGSPGGATGATGPSGEPGATGTVNAIAGSVLTKFIGNGSTSFYPIYGYTTNNVGSYIVSVGGIDQLPTDNYTISSDNEGTITFSSAPPIDEIITVRAFTGTGATGSNITQIQGIPVLDTTPTDGQVLTWNPTTNVWEPTSIVAGSGGNVTYTAPGINSFSVPASARWARVQATAGTGSNGTDGRSVKIANNTVALGGAAAATPVDIPFDLTSYAGQVISVEITTGAGDATITISW